MTWEEKFAALARLHIDAALHIRRPGDWYVRVPGVEIGGDHLLRGISGNGASPQAAIEDAWRKVTELTPGQVIVINAMSETGRRHVRWADFMWMDVPR